MVLAVWWLVAACGSSPSSDALRWCSEHQDDVARVALELGLLEAGTRYSEWKQSDPEGYDRACREAYATGG